MGLFCLASAWIGTSGRSGARWRRICPDFATAGGRQTDARGLGQPTAACGQQGLRPKLSTMAVLAEPSGRRIPILPDVIDVDALLESCGGILLAREHRRRKSSLSRWYRAGRLGRILPGVYVHPAAVDDTETRIRAVVARIPDAVLAGPAAARFTSWPDEQIHEVDVIVPGRRVPRPGFRFHRRRVPPELVTRRSGVAVLTPALLAIDSAADDNGERIDDLLRGHWPLTVIQDAFQATPRRRGNRRRRRVLHRSRTQPWSQAERALLDLLDRHRITGWTANLPVTARGRQYVLDVGFEALRVALEVDGFEYHNTRRAFDYDRERGNDLVEDDWRVLHVTTVSLEDEPRLVRRIRAVLASRSRRRAPPGG